MTKSIYRTLDLEEDKHAYNFSLGNECFWMLNELCTVVDAGSVLLIFLCWWLCIGFMCVMCCDSRLGFVIM